MSHRSAGRRRVAERVLTIRALLLRCRCSAQWLPA
jgi:hypothetical protein